MSTARLQAAPRPVSAPGSPEPATTQAPDTRDRLAARSPRIDAERPDVLDLERELLDFDLAPHLRGLVSLFADGSAVHLREALRGERHVHLALICRLVRSRRPEARRAAAALVSRLQAELQAAEEEAGAVEDLHELLADAAEQTTDVVAVGVRALRDGVIDDEEHRRWLAEVAEAQAALGRVRERLEEHRSSGRRSRRAAGGDL